jgi:hypothetical protein
MALNVLVQSCSELESNIVSVERIVEYFKLPHEVTDFLYFPPQFPLIFVGPVSTVGKRVGPVTKRLLVRNLVFKASMGYE